MKVEVRLASLYANVAGTRRLELELGEGATVGSALNHLVATFGRGFEQVIFFTGTDKLQPSLQILVNGRNAYLEEGLNTCLREGDVIWLSMVVSGG